MTWADLSFQKVTPAPVSWNHLWWGERGGSREHPAHRCLCVSVGFCNPDTWKGISQSGGKHVWPLGTYATCFGITSLKSLLWPCRLAMPTPVLTSWHLFIFFLAQKWCIRSCFYLLLYHLSFPCRQDPVSFPVILMPRTVPGTVDRQWVKIYWIDNCSPKCMNKFILSATLHENLVFWIPQPKRMWLFLLRGRE